MSEAKARELTGRLEVASRGEHRESIYGLVDEVAEWFRAYLAAVPAPPAGPPREPTEEMWQAAISALMRLYHGDGGWIGPEAAKEQARVTWVAMMRAAPAAEPVAQQPRPREPKLMKAAIAIDDWKLPIFERRLSQAGYAYEKGDGLTPGTLHLYVVTDNMTALHSVVRAANDEARLTGKP